MELIKKPVTYGRCNKRLITQLTFDDDINVSDANADIRDIIMQTGHIRMEEMRVLGGKIRLAGHLEFSVLYSSEDNGTLSCIHGNFGFEESMNYDEGQEGEMITVLWEMEDLRVQAIHSRKMNVKAVVTFSVYPANQMEIQAAADVSGQPDLETLTRTEQFTGLKVCGKDILRVKESFLLPGGKPDVDRIVFQNMKLHNIKTRAQNGSVQVSAELILCMLYRPVDEQLPMQWLERQIPVNGEVEVSKSADFMISASMIQLAHTEISLSEDEDGEMRQITAEAVLQCDLMLYEEQKLVLLEDVYVPEMEFEITRPEISVTTLENSNDSRMKTNISMQLHALKPLVQVIYTNAEVKVEEYHPGDEGLVLEGIITVDLLYQQVDPENPFHAAQETVPFTYTVQMSGWEPQENDFLQVISSVEQISAVLSGADEAEVRILAGFTVISCRQKPLRVITDVKMKPADQEKIERMPGIIGYLVQPQDTLWSIARKFYVSLSSIREVNGLKTDEIKAGQRLLIVK